MANRVSAGRTVSRVKPGETGREESSIEQLLCLDIDSIVPTKIRRKKLEEEQHDNEEREERE